MTHTRKKFVSKIKVDYSFNSLNVPPATSEMSNFEEYDQVFIQIEDNQVILGFLYLHNGKPIAIPEPNPCILYFTSAEKNLTKIIQLQKDILHSDISNNSHNIADLFFTFFQLSSNLVINLFKSIEAFNNSVIPNDFTYRVKKKLYDKNSIQRYVTHDIKIEKIIPQIFSKSFPLTFPEKNQILAKMKQLRDNAIHMKNHNMSFSASYRELFRAFISFNYQEAYNCTKDYVNFYHDNLIEDCDCGKI